MVEVVFIALLIPLIASAQSLETLALKRLEKRAIPFTKVAFMEHVGSGHTDTVKLFLVAGMDPNVSIRRFGIPGTSTRGTIHLHKALIITILIVPSRPCPLSGCRSMALRPGLSIRE